ncbi:MAG: polysaccharide deacetylase family protein [Clostridiales bacterium]|nr:polysaccharide deacetylase family protein [Clostridiales bacterium]
MKRVVSLVLLLLLLLPNLAWAEQTPPYITQYTHGDQTRNRIAITIDDWWDPELLPDFLDVARDNGIKLTLYPVGVNLKESDRDLWLRVIAEGHEIGNHSNTHRDLAEASRDSIIKQLTNMENNLNKVLGEPYVINTVRYPFGSGRMKGLRSAFARAVSDAGYIHTVLWDVDTSKQPVNRIVPKVKNGSIVLLHANNGDLKKLKTLLPLLAEKGFEMVTVSELLGLTKTGRVPENP